MGITLELTDEQAQHLAELLDIATKAGGIQAAKFAVPIMDALMDAAKQSKEAMDSEPCPTS